MPRNALSPQDMISRDLDAIKDLVRELLLTGKPQSPQALKDNAERIFQEIESKKESLKDRAADPASYRAGLMRRRHQAAEEIFASHDFGAIIEGHGGWVVTEDEDQDTLSIDVYLRDEGRSDVKLVLAFDPESFVPKSIKVSREPEQDEEFAL